MAQRATEKAKEHLAANRFEALQQILITIQMALMFGTKRQQHRHRMLRVHTAIEISIVEKVSSVAQSKSKIYLSLSKNVFLK